MTGYLHNLPDPRQEVMVLAISPFEDVHHSLQRVFSQSKWHLYKATSRAEAMAFLRNNPVSVVLCECELPDGNWKDMIYDLATLENAPKLIVTSRVADDRLWLDVLNIGGYDLVVRPFYRPELVRLISLAWRQWKEELERTNSALTVSV